MSGWELLVKWTPKMLDGVALTLELVAIAVVAGLIVALPLGIARASRHWHVRALPYGYIFFFRGTPLLVQLFLVYYGLAQFDAIRQGPLWPYLRDPFWCAVITMTLHTAAYIAEILRGAIQAIPKGEIEAARALGMSRGKTLFYIMLPRATRIGLPAYSNEVILMLHSTSIAFTATVPDILKVARDVNSATYASFEAFGIAAVLYASVVFALVWLFRRCERRWLAYLQPRAH